MGLLRLAVSLTHHFIADTYSSPRGVQSLAHVPFALFWLSNSLPTQRSAWSASLTTSTCCSLTRTQVAAHSCHHAHMAQLRQVQTRTHDVTQLLRLDWLHWGLDHFCKWDCTKYLWE